MASPKFGKFKCLWADADWIGHGGKWIARVSGRRFHVIEFTNMDEACGRDNEGHPPYVVELSEINLDDVSESVMKSAFDCIGAGGCESQATDVDRVEALHSYGARAPLWDVAGSNAHKMMRDAVSYSARLSKDAALYDERMNGRAVNKLGSTAAEFAKGDIYSAIGRGLDECNREAELMLKLLGGKL